MSLKKIIPLVVSASILVVIGLIHLLHGIFADRKMVYREEPFYSPKVPPALDGYTIAFVTDPHGVGQKKLAEVVAKIQRRRVDVLLLGGDFSSKEKKTATDLDLLAQIQPPDGTYGVKGNHDRKNNLFPLMRDRGMVPLANQGHILREGLYLGGTEDYRRGDPNIARSVKGAKEDDFVLLLAHNPDVSMLPGGDLVDLVLSGHIHGGEVSFFGLWSPLVPFESDYGWRFPGGWSTSSYDTPVYVSNGVGNHLPFRIYCPPQTIFLTLHSGEPPATKEDK